MQGPPLDLAIPGCMVRPALDVDAAACDRVCRAVHGHDRGRDLREAIGKGTAAVVERGGRITGYTTQIAFFGHAVGETDDDVKALIGAAKAFAGPGFLLPMRNAELFRWCLDQGLRMVHQCAGRADCGGTGTRAANWTQVADMNIGVGGDFRYLAAEGQVGASAVSVAVMVNKQRSWVYVVEGEAPKSE